MYDQKSTSQTRLLLVCNSNKLNIVYVDTVYGKPKGFLVVATYVEGHGDLVSRLQTPVTHTVTLVIPIVNLLALSPRDPPNNS